MNENLPTVSQTGVAVVRGDALTKEQVALVKRTIMPDGARPSADLTDGGDAGISRTPQHVYGGVAGRGRERRGRP